TDGLVDVADALVLLCAGPGDVPHELADALHLGHDLADDLASLAHQAAACVHLLYAAGDQVLDLACGLGTALRKGAHLAGHNRKTSALLTCPRRFHGGV